MNMVKTAVLMEQEEEVKALASHVGFWEVEVWLPPFLICHQMEVNG
jgi:hypothetical protein